MSSRLTCEKGEAVGAAGPDDSLGATIHQRKAAHASNCGRAAGRCACRCVAQARATSELVVARWQQQCSSMRCSPIECVVLTGSSKYVANSSQNAAAVSAQSMPGVSGRGRRGGAQRQHQHASCTAATVWACHACGRGVSRFKRPHRKRRCPDC